MDGLKVPAECSDALSRHLKPDLFKALCDPSRLALVARLAAATRPLTVSEAAECCGVHLSGVSRHLSLMRRAGAVIAEKRGREVTYRVNFQELIGTLRGLADALEDCVSTTGCCSPTDSGERT